MNLINTIVLVAICSLTLLESFAIFMGEDSVYFGTVTAFIAGLAGFYGHKIKSDVSAPDNK